MTVPYEVIDVEVRRLVWLLNEIPGITTLFSCAGHANEREDPEGYVRFTAESQAALARVVTALPFVGARGALVANRYEYQTLTVDVQSADGHLAYDLRFSGKPLYIQRQLLADVEHALEPLARERR